MQCTLNIFEKIRVFMRVILFILSKEFVKKGHVNVEHLHVPFFLALL